MDTKTLKALSTVLSYATGISVFANLGYIALLVFKGISIPLYAPVSFLILFVANALVMRVLERKAS